MLWLLSVCSFFHTFLNGNSRRITPNICPVNSLNGFTDRSPAPCTTWPQWTHTRTTQYWRYWSMAVTFLWVPALWAQSEQLLMLFCTQTSVSVQNRHEMLQTDPLSRLLDSKWKMFAGRMFFTNFLVYLLYLGIFTAIAYNKKDGKVGLLVRTVSLICVPDRNVLFMFLLCPTEAIWTWTHYTRLPVCFRSATDSTGQHLFLFHGGMPFSCVFVLNKIQWDVSPSYGSFVPT